MSKIEQTEAPGHRSRVSTSESGAGVDMVDVALLLVTILILMGIATGIAIGFPLALEVVAAQANATTVVSSTPHLGARPRAQQEEKIEEEDEPLIIDDVRSGKLMYAATRDTAPLDRSIPQPSATCP